MNFPILPNELPQLCDIYETIDQAKLLKVNFPSRPVKPVSPERKDRNATPIDYRTYADLLEKYENDLEKYQTVYADVNAHNIMVDILIEKYIKSVSGLNDIPEQYQNKLWRLAYERGHSSGYYEVYQQLVDLVDIFE